MNIILYFSETSPSPGKQWLAHMDLGNDIYMSFFGPTEVEAKDRAERWYAGERKRWSKKETNEPVKAVVSSEKKIDDWSNEWATMSSLKPAGEFKSDHKLSGSVWVINRATAHRARIAADQLATYEANGYVRGGPRSK